jgi:Flp pilus assembly protein TadG
MARTPRVFSEELGSALVETALSLALLLTTIVGIIYSSMALYAYGFVCYAAQQGTRYAIVRGASWGSASCTSAATLSCNATAANVTSYVQSLATPGLTAGSIAVTITWPGQTVNGSTSGCSTTNSPPCLVAVQVSYPFSFSLPFMPNSTTSFKSTSEQVIQD